MITITRLCAFNRAESHNVAGDTAIELRFIRNPQFVKSNTEKD